MIAVAMTVQRVRGGLRLDDLDKLIISQLQEDGRRSYASIAGAVGLSEAAARHRVRKLLEAGVMQIVAVTDPLTLGFRRQAMIGITADGDLEEIAAHLSALPEIEYVVICAGSFDIIIELVCEDDEQLISIVNGKVRAIEGVRSTETFMYLRLAKQTYAWGVK